MNPFEMMQSIGPLAEQAKQLIAELPEQLQKWNAYQAQGVALLNEMNERLIRIEAMLSIDEDNPRHVELSEEQRAQVATWPDPGPMLVEK